MTGIEAIVAAGFRGAPIISEGRVSPNPTIGPSGRVSKRRFRPIKPDLRSLFERVKLHVPLDVRFAAPIEHLLDALDAGLHRFIANEDIDALPLGRDGFEHLHHALNERSLRLVIEGEAPRTAIDPAPSLINSVVKRAGLKARIGIQQGNASGAVARDYVILIFGRQSRKVIVAENRPNREIR